MVRRGSEVHILHCDGSLKCLAVSTFSKDDKMQATTLHDVMEITNGQSWQNSSQYSAYGEEPNTIAGS
jgi:hypothetical protein